MVKGFYNTDYNGLVYFYCFECAGGGEQHSGEVLQNGKENREISYDGAEKEKRIHGCL